MSDSLQMPLACMHLQCCGPESVPRLVHILLQLLPDIISREGLEQLQVQLLGRQAALQQLLQQRQPAAAQPTQEAAQATLRRQRRWCPGFSRTLGHAALTFTLGCTTTAKPHEARAGSRCQLCNYSS